MYDKKRLNVYKSSMDKWGKEKGTAYARVYRHLHYFMGKFITTGEREFFTEAELQELLRRETGFTIKPETLRKYLRRVEEGYGQAPLEPAYRVNREFFEKHPPKPPRTNRRRR